MMEDTRRQAGAMDLFSAGHEGGEPLHGFSADVMLYQASVLLRDIGRNAQHIGEKRCEGLMTGIYLGSFYTSFLSQ